MKDKVLIIAAHPDDEVLGCGGTIAKFVKEGCKVYTLILGEGITSRDSKRDRSKRASEIKNLKKQTAEANKALGVEKVFTFDFPDNRFDTVPLLDIIKKVEEVKKQVKPTIVFTHHHNDLNIDHIITRKAALTATRPMKNETVKTIYAFEILSSTEWNYPLSFSPNVFFDVSKTFKIKTKALRYYKDELRKLPHPRSLEAVELNAKMWGLKAGVEYAEAFELVRQIN